MSSSPEEVDELAKKQQPHDQENDDVNDLAIVDALYSKDKKTKSDDSNVKISIVNSYRGHQRYEEDEQEARKSNRRSNPVANGDDDKDMDIEAPTPPELTRQLGTLHRQNSQPGAVAVPGMQALEAPRIEESTLTRRAMDRQPPAPPRMNSSSTTVGSTSSSPFSLAAPPPESALTLVEATKVHEGEDLEAAVRERILNEAVQANLVSTDGSSGISRKLLIFALVVVLVVVVVVAILFVSPTDNNGDNMQSPPPMDLRPTLQIVQERGRVRCGVYDSAYGFSAPPIIDDANKNGTVMTEDQEVQLEGMNIEHVSGGFCIDLSTASTMMPWLLTHCSLQCRAVALLALGDSSKFEPVYVSSKQRFTSLEVDRDIDVLAQTATHTMGRDVFEPKANASLRFSVPFMYTGMAFGGVPEFVQCADELDTRVGQCRQLQVCVGDGTTHERIVRELLPATAVVRTNDPQEHITFLNDGTCNVIVKDQVALPAIRVRNQGYHGPYAIGTRIFSREPLALVTRDSDPAWSDLVNSVVQFMYTAESIGLTQEKALQELSLDGEASVPQRSALESSMLLLISELGNYGEVYQRTLERIVPRDGLNWLYSASNNTKNNTDGLLYYFPFGNLETDRRDPTPGGTLERILQRGHLVCGLSRLGPGFAQRDATDGLWKGLDVELCRALSAALFIRRTDNIEYVDLSNGTARFQALSIGAVDILAGERLSLETNMNETSTGMGYTFSSPYFFDKNGDAYGLLTSQDDTQWADFVYWIIMGLIYAENENITSTENVDNMPAVNLFGQQLKQMFLDCVLAVGNYGEIYSRTVNELVPRSGGNFLNRDLSGPQQLPLPLH